VGVSSERELGMRFKYCTELHMQTKLIELCSDSYASVKKIRLWNVRDGLVEKDFRSSRQIHY